MTSHQCGKNLYLYFGFHSHTSKYFYFTVRVMLCVSHAYTEIRLYVISKLFCMFRIKSPKKYMFVTTHTVFEFFEALLKVCNHVFTIFSLMSWLKAFSDILRFRIARGQRPQVLCLIVKSLYYGEFCEW